MAKVKVEKDTAERWLLTYADLMNLLLILFILLFAMSQIDRAKFDQLAQSFKTIGISSGNKITPVSGGGNTIKPLTNNLPSTPVIKSKLEQQQMDQIQKKVEQLTKNGNLDGKVDVQMQERGIVISITAQLLFLPGSADIVPGSKPTVQQIGQVLKGIPGNQIRIEGYTDTDPIHTEKFPSNWDLSSGRATNILRILVDNSGIDPNIIAATGYGQTKPVAPNNTPENKAKNRRVNIVILKKIYDVAEPSSTVNNTSQATLPKNGTASTNGTTTVDSTATANGTAPNATTPTETVPKDVASGLIAN
jgi:chemotaxis protein MotB